MRTKSALFVFVLWFSVGCGVMNNPSSDKEGVEDALTNDTEIFFEVSKIDGGSIRDISIAELESYKIFETSALTELFLTDLNTSSQTLASGDSAIVQTWIKNIHDANMSYQTENFLFYPILRDEDCGRKGSIKSNDANLTITIQSTTTECDTASVYHVLMYKVDKDIENIVINIFDEENVTITNSGH